MLPHTISIQKKNTKRKLDCFLSDEKKMIFIFIFLLSSYLLAIKNHIAAPTYAKETPVNKIGAMC